MSRVSLLPACDLEFLGRRLAASLGNRIELEPGFGVRSPCRVDVKLGLERESVGLGGVEDVVRGAVWSVFCILFVTSK